MIGSISVILNANTKYWNVLIVFGKCLMFNLNFLFAIYFLGWNKLTNFWAPIRTWPLIMKMLLLKCMPNRDLKHKSKWISFSNLVQPHYSYLKQYPCLNETKLYFYCVYRTALFFIWFKKFHCKSMFQTLYMIRWGLVFEKFLFVVHAVSTTTWILKDN